MATNRSMIEGAATRRPGDQLVAMLGGVAVLAFFATVCAADASARPAAAPSTHDTSKLEPLREIAARGADGTPKAPRRGSSAELQGGSSADRYGGTSADKRGVAGERDNRVHGKPKRPAREPGDRANRHRDDEQDADQQDRDE